MRTISGATACAKPPKPASWIYARSREYTADSVLQTAACRLQIEQPGFYSDRNAADGSMIAARRAGTAFASPATANNVTIAPIHVTGSRYPIQYSAPETALAAAADSNAPTTT